MPENGFVKIMKITRSKIRRLISEAIAPDISVVGGGVKIGKHIYKISADTWGGELDVVLEKCTPQPDGSWIIKGSTSIKEVERPMAKEKVQEVLNNLGKEKFTVSGKLANFIFRKVN